MTEEQVLVVERVLVDDGQSRAATWLFCKTLRRLSARGVARLTEALTHTETA